VRRRSAEDTPQRGVWGVWHICDSDEETVRMLLIMGDVWCEEFMCEEAVLEASGERLDEEFGVGRSEECGTGIAQVTYGDEEIIILKDLICISRMLLMMMAVFPGNRFRKRIEILVFV
jgi:hypothetical protein